MKKSIRMQAITARKILEAQTGRKHTEYPYATDIECCLNCTKNICAGDCAKAKNIRKQKNEERSK